jgi:hypothetical protein
MNSDKESSFRRFFGLRKLSARHRSRRAGACMPTTETLERFICIFRFEWTDGTVTRMEELAYQHWEGERIAEEQFFYDPAQRIPVKPAG